MDFMDLAQIPEQVFYLPLSCTPTPSLLLWAGSFSVAQGGHEHTARSRLTSTEKR